MKMIFRISLSMLVLIYFSTSILHAQNKCPLDSPGSFSVEQDKKGNCFLVITWPENEMPALRCGRPGRPARGSSRPKGKLIDLEFNGVFVWEKGNNCKGEIYNLAYHPTIPNAYITTVSLCEQANAATIKFEANRTGGSNHVCEIVNNNTLPVELMDFFSFGENEKSILEWATASEINNKHFEIERSANGQDFEVIGIKSGMGNSTVITTYRFVDETPLVGENYYRLKQVDYDGVFEYSEVVTFYKEIKNKMSFYPTNIIDKGTLLFETTKRGELQVALIDINGKVLKTNSLVIEKGTNRFELDYANLPNGMYFLSTVNHGRVQTTRLIKSGL